MSAPTHTSLKKELSSFLFDSNWPLNEVTGLFLVINSVILVELLLMLGVLVSPFPILVLALVASLFFSEALLTSLLSCLYLIYTSRGGSASILDISIQITALFLVLLSVNYFKRYIKETYHERQRLLLNNLLHLVPLPVFKISASTGRIISINEKVMSEFKYDTSLVHQSASSLFTPASLPKAQHELALVLRKNLIRETKLTLKTPTEEKDVQVTFLPLQDKHASYIVLLVNTDSSVDDIKTEFISIAAHQLRTPLGSMRWNLELILGGSFGKLPNELQGTFTQLYANNLRMISLVNNLLNVSRIDQGKIADEPSDFDPKEAIQNLIRDIEYRAKENNVKLYLLDPDIKVPMLHLDPKQFHEVMQNLLSNAIKYNKKGGKVMVEVSKKGSRLEIEVSDTGMGIPKDAKSHLFEKFFRASNAVKSETEGSGLGLYVVKSFVESWGGTLSCDSKEGDGTSFTVTIPLKTKEDA